MVLAGLAVRIVCIVLTPFLYHWPNFRNFEMANIAYSLALGHGFASPWGDPSGPTAWTPPVYPFLVALAFRVFGIFSISAEIALLLINSVFSALTSWTIYRIALRVFDEKVAAWSGWVWALFPYAIYWSVCWIWETTLSTFLLSLLFMLTLEMEDDNRLWPWVRYGLLWGIIALTSTSALAWLPFSGGWLVYRLYRARQRFVLPAVLSAVGFWAVITPWVVRNYVVFDKFVFIRGDMGAELRTGNNPQAHGPWEARNHVGNIPSLRAEYVRVGEVAFDAEQKREAQQWIAEDPVRFLALTGRRVFYFWYGAPEMLLLLTQPLFICMNVLAVGGLVHAIRRRIPYMFLFATLFIFFPLIYYITFAFDRYHHPIEPELMILAVWVLVAQKKASERPIVTGRGLASLG